MAAIRVLIVDDHPMMRHGLRETLLADPELEICAEAADVGEALDAARESKPQVALIDISLPSGSGLELAKRMLTVRSDVKILFVSMHDDAVFAERGLRAGALGYINKERPAKELLEAVRKVARGEFALSQSMTERLVRRGINPTRKGPSGVERLSDRELEVFELIGRGLGTRDIAERLSLSIKTVESHRENIKSKLNLDSGTELSRQATLWINAQA